MQFGPKPRNPFNRKFNGVNGHDGQITYHDLAQTWTDHGRVRVIDLIQKMLGNAPRSAAKGVVNGQQNLLHYLLAELLTDKVLTEPDMRNAHRMFYSGSFETCQHFSEKCDKMERSRSVFGARLPHCSWNDIAMCETILFIVTPSNHRRNAVFEMESSGCFRWHDQSRVKLLSEALTDAAHDVQYLVATELHLDVKPGLLFSTRTGVHISDTLNYAMAKEVWRAAHGHALHELAHVELPASWSTSDGDLAAQKRLLDGQYCVFDMSDTHKTEPTEPSAEPKTSSKLADMRARLKQLSAQTDKDVLASIGSDTARSNTGKLLQTVSSDISGQRRN